MSTQNARPSLAKSAAILVLVAGLPAAAQTTYHVAPCGDNSWTGSTSTCAAPNGPKRTIQAAIDAAVNGDTVLVGDGTYTGPGNRDIDFRGRAITVRSAGGASVCIIDCQGSPQDPHRGFSFTTSETSSSVLEGLTIQNGNAIQGGAVFCAGGSPTIRGCTLVGNTGSQGGAIFSSGADLHLVRCELRQNSSPAGGAVYANGTGRRVYEECTFLQNRQNNPGSGGGGAVLASQGGTQVAINCRFLGNGAERLGSGLWVSFGSEAVVTGCTFTGNVALYGGALAVSANASATVANCLFTENRITGGTQGTERPASAVWVGDGFGGPSRATVVNCTFIQNESPVGAALLVTQTSTASASNCILWDNVPAGVGLLESGAITVSYSDIEGGWAGPGTGNIDDEPLLLGSGAHPFSLAAGSPGIDAGDNTAVPMGITTDLAGGPRFRDDPDTPDTGVGPAPIVDMGAYEFNGCYADCDSSTGLRVLDIFDFLCFQNRFASSDPYACDCDTTTGTGVCDIFDFLCFQNAYDAGCP